MIFFSEMYRRRAIPFFLLTVNVLGHSDHMNVALLFFFRQTCFADRDITRGVVQSLKQHLVYDPR